MMPGVRRFLRRAVTLVRSNRADAELDREIQAHLRLLEDQFTAQGMTREDARYAAKRAFGGVEQVKERQRDERAFRWLAGWPMDIRLGLRMLVKSPGLTVIAVTALAVAIGAGAAYLELVNDVLRPSLSFTGSDRVVGVGVWNTERGEAQRGLLRQFAAWRAGSHSFAQLGAVRTIDRPLITGDGRADPPRGVETTAAAFQLIPATPLLGRALLEDDERPGSPPVAVIGYDLWQSRFGGDPGIIGRTARLGTTNFTIAGVMPEGFAFPVNQNLWTPLQYDAAALRAAEATGIQIFGRLKESVTPESAGAELSAMLPPDAPRLQVTVRPYLESLLSAETERPAIEKLLYSGNLLFVLLLAICGANVATLVFARTATREAEITVRTALGASRARISAQLFAEALVLSLASAMAGLALAAFVGRWAGRAAADALGQPLPFWWDAGLGVPTVLYALALAVFAAVIVGIVPALKATGARLQGRLREAGSGGSSMKFGRLWTGVIVTQVAITVLFLAAVVSEGSRVMRGQQDQDVTFAREQFLVGTLRIERTPAARAAQPAFQALADTLGAAPGVVGVSYATELPGTTFGQFRLEFAMPEVAAGAVPHSDGLWTRSAGVGSAYFETVGAPLVAGRFFTEAEAADDRPVAIVDETFVRLVLGGRSALGLMVRERPARAGGAPGPWHEIVGVVGDVTVSESKKSFDAMIYRPVSVSGAAPARLLVRTRGDASQMGMAVQEAALAAAPELPLANVETLARAAYDEALPTRVLVRVLGVIALVALLLSTAGIYALVSFTLARRTREIGIRVALGAAPRRIITTTFSRAFFQVALGVLIGAVPSVVLLALGGEDQGGVSGPAIPAILAVGGFVMAVAMVSCAAPLRRALRIEPMQALRTDT